MTWKGRQLQQIFVWEMSTGAQYTLSYTYNADGIRTSKTIDGITHEYTLRGSLIMSEKWTQNNVEHLLMYLYDETGSPIGLQYRNSSYAVSEYDLYFFEKNLQGDIIAIYNESATKICTYKYDAWGNCSIYYTNGISTQDRAVAQTYNPFRYRGYYYDVETGWYYLQSRYYQPIWGRFINPDGVACLGANGDFQGYNLYAYCSNNPVTNIDPYGTFNWGNLIGAVAVVVAVTALCVITAGVAAAAIGASAAVTTTAVAATAASGVIAGSVAIADQIIEEGDVVDPISPAGDAFSTAMSVATTSLTSGASTVAKVGLNVANTTFQFTAGTMENIGEGKTLGEAMDQTCKEMFASAVVGKVTGMVFKTPYALDIILSVERLLLPEEK